MDRHGFTYGKGALERDVVPANTVDGSIGDCGLAVLEGRSDVDGLPLDWGLPAKFSITVAIGTSAEDVTFAAEKMSLTD